MKKTLDIGVLGLLLTVTGCSGKLNNLGTVNMGGEGGGGSSSVSSQPSGGSAATGGNNAGGASTGAATGGGHTGGSSSAFSTGGLGTGGSATGGLSGTGGSGSPPARDLHCTSDTDCCVVLDNCGDALWLVTLAQQAELQAYFSGLSTTMCPACMPPPVQVACQSGLCVGTQLTMSSSTPMELMRTHCGPIATGGGTSTLAPSAAAQGGAPSAAAAATTDAGTAKTVFGCG
jgi:hypothetical protein